MKTLGVDIQQNLPMSTTHGGPYDRGGADSYYRRGFDPHWYPDGTHQGERIEMKDMSPEEIVAYTKGYNENEDDGNFKDWG
jgi:hypothetical protein